MKNMISGAGVKLDFITSDDMYERLQKFAESFGHHVTNRKYPLIAMRENDKWFGYAQIVNAPVAFTGWHTDPSVCSPRQVVEAFKILSGWAKVQHGGGMAAVPTNTSSFLPSVMERLGFERMGAEIYEIKAE